MTISHITSGGSQAFVADETLQGSGTDIAAEVALLMLETQESRKQSDREQLSLARRDFGAALEDQVEALKSAADAQFRGALFQAGMNVAASSFEAWGLSRNTENNWQARAGGGLARLSQPLGEMVGTSYGEANAKSAEGVATAAKWQLDDARKAIDDRTTQQDKALDWLGSIVEQDAATMSAILSNKV